MFRKRYFDEKYYLFVKHEKDLVCDGFRCHNNADFDYYRFCINRLCNKCLLDRFSNINEDIDYVCKYHLKDIIQPLEHNFSLMDSVYFYIGKYVKDRNRKHKIERYCYHFHKKTCKTIYQFCLFAKRYYPIHLNKDIRFKICKLILEE